MDKQNWQPSASLQVLRQRAVLLAKIRRYFDEQGVLEVETPVLSQFGGTDVQLDQWLTTEGHALHTSPEFAMKRLLAAGSGDIFQICRVFRRDEQGARHNPEFSMLEWYRVGQDEFQLMEDVTRLMRYLSGQDHVPVHLQTYAEAFAAAGLPDPHITPIAKLRSAVSARLQADATDWSRDDCLEALMAMVVEPSFRGDILTFVYQFPASQAALAEHVSVGGVTVARRFELFYRGMELANGYFELTDPEEQRSRFEQDCRDRLTRGLMVPELDRRFLAALKHGMPVCSGVALGLDRLMMILLDQTRIDDVVAFPFGRA